MSLLFGRKRNTLVEIGKVAMPSATATHTPIPHLLLIDKAKAAMKASGLRVLEQEHQLASGGMRYFGGFAVEGDDMKSDDRRLVIGLRNAHDKSFAAAICVGNQMMVCDNLCFSSDEKLARRHTKNILRDIGRVLGGAIARVKSHWLSMEERIALYKSLELTRDQAAGLICDLCDAKAFTDRNAIKAVREFMTPGYDLEDRENAAERAEAFGGQTLWSLYNSLTHQLKGGNLSLLPHRTMTMQSIFDRMVEFAPVIGEETAESEVIDIEATQV